ncbi:MAG: hypothetical protein F4018_01100 [Acidobacteria bacterium]|nr:hypothetical protein [Acidobacteriota bacterium]
MMLLARISPDLTAPADGDVVVGNEHLPVERAFDDQMLSGPQLAGCGESLPERRHPFRKIELREGAQTVGVAATAVHRTRGVHGKLERETGVEPATFSLGS